MRNLFKALDHYRKLFREGDMHCSILKGEDCYWLTDGYMVHKIPEKEMELNPALFKQCQFDMLGIVKTAETGVVLVDSGLVQIKAKHDSMPLIPFTPESGNPFTIWFRKKYLDTFPTNITLIGTSPVSPAAVQDCGETIGVILPCRNEKDITLFM